MADQVVRTAEEFFFLSSILGRPVVSTDGEEVGSLVDLGCAAGEPFPRVLTYYIRPSRWSPVVLAAPAPGFAALPAAVLRLDKPTAELQAAARRTPTEILLRREILDKQIVDTDGARVVRVNDIHLLRARGLEVRVIHVDIGTLGLFRRLGWERWVAPVLKTLGNRPKLLAEERLLAWKYVLPLRSAALSADLKLSVTQRQLEELHPAELAEILEDLDRFEAPAVLQALDVPKAAETLAELPAEVQQLLLESLDLKRVGELLAAMAPDEAADLIEEMPSRLRDKLLAALPAADAATVEELLAQEPDTAGSVMNPEVFTVPPGTRIAEVSRLLRQGPDELVDGYAVTVVDQEHRLKGVIAFPDLLRADPEAVVEEVMHDDPPHVSPDEHMDEVAELFDRFNLLSLPVVDDEGRIEGIVTVDDLVAWMREGKDREGRIM
jgi:magnesium transporter